MKRHEFVMGLILLLLPIVATQDLTSDCLYFTSSNSKLFIGQVGRANISLSSFEPVSLSGLTPTGVAIYDGVAYVVSVRGVEYLNLTDLPHSDDVPSGQVLTRSLIQFAEFLNQFQCTPKNMRAYNYTLYIACEEAIPYSVIRFSINPSTRGQFLNGVVAPKSTKGWDLLVYDTNNQTILVFDDSDDRFIYRANLTAENYNSTVFASCWLCSPDPSPYNISEYRGMAFIRTVGFFVVIEFSKVSARVGLNRVLAFDINNGTIRDVPVNQAVNFTDTSGLAVSGDFLNFVFFQPVSLIPGYIVGFYTPTSFPKDAFSTGQFNAAPSEIYPQFGEFAACPNYTESFIPDSGAPPLSDEAIILIVVFGTLFVLAVACMFCLFLCFFVGAVKWQGRRRTYDVREMEELSRIPLNEEGWSYKEIDPGELRFDKVLGSGAFGKVYKGFWRGADVAIKTLETVSLDRADEDTLNEIRAEAQVMARLGNHPNIVSFIGAVTKSQKPDGDEEEDGDEEDGKSQMRNKLCLVLEFCPRGSLFDCLVKRKEKIPYTTIIRMARDAANGILHLHHEKIIHRDIAARNILLGQNYEVYISDFGMARLKETDTHTTQSNIGPIAWMAPESLVRREYSEASDAFSFGVLLWEMVTRKVPWRGMQPVQIIIAVAKQNTRLKIPSDCDPVVKHIIMSVWKVNPAKRMKMQEISDKLSTYYEKLKDLYEVMDEELEDEEGESSYGFASSGGGAAQWNGDVYMTGGSGGAIPNNDEGGHEQGEEEDDSSSEFEANYVDAGQREVDSNIRHNSTYSDVNFSPMSSARATPTTGFQQYKEFDTSKNKYKQKNKKKNKKKDKKDKKNYTQQSPLTPTSYSEVKIPTILSNGHSETELVRSVYVDVGV